MKILKFSNHTLTIFAALFLILVSCEKEIQEETVLEEELELFTESSLNASDVLNEALENTTGDFKCGTPAEICGEYKFYPLIASQQYYAGALIVYNDADYLYVIYWSRYRLSDFHLFVGDANELPVNGGNNPQIGHFQHKYEAAYGTHFKAFAIPLDEVPECYTLAAHATVGRHTIWAKSCTDPITFKELYGGNRWGWVIQDCVTKCETEEELILTAKIQLKDTLTAGTAWGILSTGTPSPLFSGWCDYMSVVGIEGSNTYSVIAPHYLGSIKIADMIVENAGSDLNVTFITDVPNNVIEWSYVFVGTEEELVSLTNECPEYMSFPYSNTTWNIQHSYSIPLD
jgi:hypothetical protein